MRVVEVLAVCLELERPAAEEVDALAQGCERIKRAAYDLRLHRQEETPDFFQDPLAENQHYGQEELRSRFARKPKD